MNKNLKKLLILSASACSVAALGSCASRGGDDSTQVIADKTQLYLTNFDGGVGSEWLTPLIKAFEESEKDNSYEDGKKGVQVQLVTTKENGKTMASTFKGSTIDVMFNEYIPYNSYVSKGNFLAIDDVVTENNPNDSKKIADKMSEEEKSSLTAYDGHYYAIPHYQVYCGIVYDKDLFADEKLYFADNEENGNNGFVLSATDKRSCGPDGVYGSDDDGLPSSYEEFYSLCDYMVEKGITPFIWTGQYAADYTFYLVESMSQTFAGKEEYSYNYTFDSKGKTANIITSFNGDTPVVEKKSITPSSGYLLRQEEGKYYGLQFLEKILSNTDYSNSLSRTGSTTHSHTDAQQDYLLSKPENKPIAMLLDGTWWENEAKNSGAIADMEKTYNIKEKDRNFGFMALPSKLTGRVKEGEGSKSVFADYISSYAVINANIDESKAPLAKNFLRFCYSDSWLESFTETTGIARGLTYSMSETSLSNMTPFAQSAWKMHLESDSIYTHSSSKIFVNNESTLTNEFWNSTIGSEKHERPFTPLKGGKTAKEYFLGMAYTEETWKEKYGKDF